MDKRLQKQNRQEKLMADLVALGGICGNSDWTTGSGRNLRPRRSPEGAQRFFRDYSFMPKHVAEFFDANPQFTTVVAIVDEFQFAVARAIFERTKKHARQDTAPLA
jgi:hypothetical protein